MTSGECLDLRKAPWNREENNIYRGRTKKVAQAFAKKNGWPTTKDIHLACNNIEAWWVVAQCVGDQIIFLRRDGSTITLPYPGYV